MSSVTHVFTGTKTNGTFRQEDRRPIKDHVARYNTAFALCFNCLRG